MPVVKTEENGLYENLLRQAGKCDSIAHDIRIIAFIKECSELTKKELTDYISTLQDSWTTENEQFKKDKVAYDKFKEDEKKAVVKLNELFKQDQKDYENFKAGQLRTTNKKIITP